MTAPDLSTRCLLAVDSHVRFLPIIRLFVGAVAREWGVAEDGVADLRVGASELAAAAMLAAPGEVRVEMRQEVGTIVVSVSPLDQAALDAGDEPADDVVGGLFDDLEVGEGMVTIRTGPAP